MNVMPGAVATNFGRNRLTAQSPHVAELTQSKQALAAEIYGAFDRKMRDLLRKVLREGGIERADAVDMFFAAAVGTLKTGDSAAKPYRARRAGQF